jgi:predicted permease
MSLWSRIGNVFREDAVTREIDEELASHLGEAIAEGRDPDEARRALGSALHQREESRDVRLIAWLGSLRADAVFGWRQLMKRKVTSAAAVLSLGLAIGACTSAFRLIDALLLRPLPVKDAGQLYNASREGKLDDGTTSTHDGWAYPDFLLMRDAVKDQAELLAASFASPEDLAYRADEDIEKAYVQYVSGGLFASFGLRPAAGRLLREDDDLKPRAHPYAVLSSDYWKRRFAKDPKVIGRTFRLGDDIFEIVGVVDAPFTGTEPGLITDIFVPATMYAGATHNDWTWHRILARVKPGTAIEPLRAKLDATSRAFEAERAKGFTGMSRQSIEKFLDQKLILEPAAAGASDMQKDYRVALSAIGLLVALVLLISCANVANLMAAQASARTREMALRVSIGAGRWRLAQLMLLESTWLAILSALIGAAFAWWSAPFVAGMTSTPGSPTRLALPADWRVLGFGLALTAFVTLLFGLGPALRASGVKPASALKGGDDPHTNRRVMHALIAAQVAFCFLVLFVAGLFAATLDRMSHRPLGFSSERLLTVETVAQRAEAPVFWDQMADHLRTVPGVESVALASWPLLTYKAWNGFVSVNGAPPGPTLAYFLNTSPGWLGTMKLPLLAGRDFRADDTTPGVAIINETFAKQFFPGGNAIGQSFAKGTLVFQVVGIAADAPYKRVKEAMLPVAFVPMHTLDSTGAMRPIRSSAFMVRTASANPMALAATLRQEIPRTHPGFRVSNLHPQEEFVRAQSMRERVVARLALFFAVVALLLAGIGLYGVLDYSVLQRRREIGIRLAIGAPAGDIAWRVSAGILRMVIVGAVAGLLLGMASVRYIETLLYQVKPTDLAILAAPSFAILTLAILAAMPAVWHAVRIDPVKMLRAD